MTLEPPRQFAALAALIVGVCAAAISLASVGGIPQVAAGILLVLVLPGLGFTMALGSRIGAAEGAAIGVALSIVLNVIVGVAASAFGVKLDADSMTVIALAVTVLSCGVAMVSLESRATPLRLSVHVSPMNAIAALAIAGVIASAVVVTAVSHRDQDRSVGFAQLWVAQASGSNPGNINLRNRRDAEQRYTVRAHQDGRVLETWHPSIAGGGSWTSPRSAMDGTGKVIITAQKDGAPHAEESVELQP